MRNMLCATALVLIALVGAGCKKEPTLVGKWTGTMQSAAVTYDFKEDKTLSISGKQGPVDITMIADYAIDKDKLTVTIKDVKLKGAPAGTEDMIKNALKSGQNKPQTSTFTFVNEDEVSMKGEKGEATTLKREKAAS